MEKPTGSPVTLVAVGDLHTCGSDPKGYFQQCRQVLRQANREYFIRQACGIIFEYALLMKCKDQPPLSGQKKWA